MKHIKLYEEFVTEAIDTKYWAGYNTDTSGQGDKRFADKSKNFDDAFDYAVEDWNNEADGPENKIKGASINKIQKLAKEFFKKEGWISVNVVQAMIMQEGGVSEAELNEYSSENFTARDISPKDAVKPKFLSKLLITTSDSAEEAAKRIKSFNGTAMATHVQYFVVRPNGNRPERPYYRIHEEQYYKWRPNDPKVDVSRLYILELKEGANWNDNGKTDDNWKVLGHVYVSTSKWLDNLKRSFEIIKRVS